jgi:Tat protein translocase TatB subunit
MDFLGMGWFEIFVVVIVALLVLGPEKLPEYARKAGRFVRQFRKITSGITKEITKAVNLDEDEGIESLRQDLDAIKKSLEKDAAELKQSLKTEMGSIQESVAESTKEAKETLVKDAAEIKQSLAADGKEIKTTIETEAREAARSLGADIPEPEEKPAPPPIPVINEFNQEDNY